MQTLQHKPQMLSRLFRKLAEHQDVIQVHKHKFANVRPKDVIHHSLKGCRCVSQAKAQHLEFIMPKRSGEFQSLAHPPAISEC